jgi:hypothetical protein
LNNQLSAQDWIEQKLSKGDTILTVFAYMKGDSAFEKAGIHKKIYKNSKNEFISLEFFDKNGKPAENEDGYYKKVKFWKYYKYYKKNGKALFHLENFYFNEWSEADLQVFEYNKKGDLKSLSYFKTVQNYGSDSNGDLITDSNGDLIKIGKPFIMPVGEAYMLTDLHKYSWEYNRKEGLLIEKHWNTEGKLIGNETFKLKDLQIK